MKCSITIKEQNKIKAINTKNRKLSLLAYDLIFQLEKPRESTENEYKLKISIRWSANHRNKLISIGLIYINNQHFKK